MKKEKSAVYQPIPRALALLVIALTGLASPPLAAAEFKLANKPGERIVEHSMVIEGGYMQPIVLAGGAENAPREKSDAYFYTHIKAASANPHGFSKFAWIPYLNVAYTIEKTGSAWRSEGRLAAAIGKFGPHYGANVKLDGVGEYRYTIRVSPPDRGINRLVDVENGITWWEPFEASWKFTYLGLGKRGVIGAKGGY